MSVSIYKKGYYEEFHALGQRKNKANSKPIMGKSKVKRQKEKMRVNPLVFRRGYLKKQTQFMGGQK